MEIPAIHGIFLYLLIIGIACLLAGAWLIRGGWFGKRRGETPHCRRCDYILTGITTDRCPECGTTLCPRTTVIGERHPRHRTAVFGCLILLLGVCATIAPLTPRFRRVDWYTYKPTPWVITDLRSGDAELRTKAWFELGDRIESGKFNERFRDDLDDATIRLSSGDDAVTPDAQNYLLGRYSSLSAAHQDILMQMIRKAILLEDQSWGRRPPKETLFDAHEAESFLRTLIEKRLLSREREHELVELALTAQASAAHPEGESTLLDFLGAKLLAGELTPAQRERFIAQVKVNVRARPLCIARANLPLIISIEGKGPSDPRWMSRFKVVKVAIDGNPLLSGIDETSVGGYWGGRGASGFWGGHGATVCAPEPGKHTLRIDGQLDIFAPNAIGPDGDYDKAIPIVSRDVHLSVPFEALLPGSPRVRWVDDPSLAQTIKHHIDLHGLGSRRNGKQWVLSLEVADLPTDISFEIIACHQGREYHLGELTDLKGNSATHGIFQDNPLPNVAVDHVDIILRSAAAPATQTVDVVAPWKGELTYPNVTIETQND